MQDPETQTGPRPRVGEQVRALLGLGLPLVGSHVAQMAIVLTDTVMMGWYDVPSLAALALSGSIWFIVFILGSGFAWAVLPLVASALARGDEREIRRVTRMGLWLSAIFGLAVAPAFFFVEAIFRAIGQDPGVAALAAIYMPWAGLAMAPALLTMVMKSYLSALELTRSILVFTLVGAVINFGLDYVLIFGHFGAPELGITGAGIATLVGNVVAFALLARHATRRRPEHDLFRNVHRPDREVLGRVFRLGWPIGLTSFAETALFAATTVMMGWVGTVALAAHGIALQITAVAFMIPLGISQAITVRAGGAWGRNDRELLRTASIAATLVTLATALVAITLFLAVPEFLLGLFVNPDDAERPDILATGTALLAVAAVFQLVDFGQVLALGMLRGVQDTRVPMIMAIISYWLVGLPVSYVMGFVLGLGGVGIWLGLTAGLALACATMHLRFWRRYALA